MKALLIVIVGIFVSLATQGPSTEDEVTFRRSERKENTKVVRKSETFFRNGRKILLTVKTLDKQGQWKVTRSYEIDKHTSVSESDEDGDGHFETLAIFYNEGKSIEAFERRKNGDVVPFSPQKLKVLREQYAKLSEIFEQGDH